MKTKNQEFIISGMHCASCSSRIEKVVSALNGVESVSVNLLTNSLYVSGKAKNDDITKAVKNAGYGIEIVQDENANEEQIDASINEGKLLLRRFLASLVFLMVLIYFSMSHKMLNFPVPHFLDSAVRLGIVQCFFSLVVIFINRSFFINGIKSVFHKSANMDTLVALGAGISFLWSVYCLFFGGELYFESAAMILTLITVGEMLEAFSKGKTTASLRSLINLVPQKTIVERNGNEIEVETKNVLVGEIFIVRPGMHIGLDGVVTEGASAVNEAAITGESIPIDKKVGDKIVSGSVNVNGFLKCRAEKVGKETTLNQIIKVVREATSSKAPIARIADKVSAVFVPIVILIAFVTFGTWLLIRENVSFALERAISVLLISCPCALGLATPVAIMVGSGVAAKQGILFKNATSLEKAGKVQIVAFDKTGTITKGELEVAEIDAIGCHTKNEVLQTAFCIEKMSRHPVARAIVKMAESMSLSEPLATSKARCGDETTTSEACPADKTTTSEISNFKETAGSGVSGILGGKKIFVGNENGKIVVKVSGEAIGFIKVKDAIKSDSEVAIKTLHKMGLKTYMITGDNEEAAKEIAEKAKVDGYFAKVLPTEKAEIVKKLGHFGHFVYAQCPSGEKSKKIVAMVGDGINDAPSLATADVGIAVSSGTDIAIDSADIVLMKNRLMDVAKSIKISRATIKNIHENLFWAFFYNVLCIPLAAGVYTNLFGWSLSPVVGSACMSISSFCVVMNALRLNFLKLPADADARF